MVQTQAVLQGGAFLIQPEYSVSLCSLTGAQVSGLGSLVLKLLGI